MEKNINPLDNIINFRDLFYKILDNWYYFLLSIFLCLAFAFSYVRYSNELFMSTTKVLIQKNSENVSASEILYENLNSSNESSIKDEINKFTSFPLVFQTVSDTEVILRMFHHYGKACAHDFNGFFAFAIYY